MTLFNRRAFLAGLAVSAALPNLAAAEPRPKPRPIAALTTGAVSAPLTTTDELIAKANLGADVSYAAFDLASGEMIDERMPTMSMAPASTLKTVTALYALAKLGPNHRFTTSVIRSGDMLVLVGGADPELDTDGLAELAKTAAAAEKAAGRAAPKRFGVWAGSLPYLAEISEGQAVHLAYNATVSGIILNFNRVYFGWKRGAKSYDMTLEARGSGVSPVANGFAISAVDRGMPLFTYDGTGGKENWTISRQSMGKSGSRWLPVRRPDLYAADVFRTVAKAQGLTLPEVTVLTDRPEGEVLARRESAPLTDLLRRMLKYSNNLTAEVVGLSASGKPTLVTSAAEMESWLRAQGVTGDFHFRDHSGLAPDNRVTAQMMAQTMMSVGQSEGLRPMMKHVPLRKVKGQPDNPKKLQIEAKTGTLNFVSNLAGYATDESGRQIAFCVLTGDETRRAATEGREMPDGVISWTRRSKNLQQSLIENWMERRPKSAPVAEPSQSAMAGAG